MSSPEEILLQRTLRVMQIAASGLLMGLVIFLTIVLIIVQIKNQGAGLAPPGNFPLISIVAVLFFALQGPLAFIAPGIQTGKGLRKIATGTWQLPPGADPSAFKSDASKLLVLRQNTMLSRLAILEGAGFFGCIAYLVEGRMIALSEILVVLFLMLMSFPTYYRMRYWRELQTDRLIQLRQDAAS